MRAKKKILGNLIGLLEDIGYTAVFPEEVGAIVQVSKKALDGLFLTIGIEKSRLYTDRYTASFYLAPCLCWSWVPSDFPKCAYRRIGGFLSKEERRQLLSEEFWGNEVVDAWWGISDNGEMMKFIDSIKMAEPRFICQESIVDMVNASKRMNEFVEIVKKTKTLRNVAAGTSNPGSMEEYLIAAKSALERSDWGSKAESMMRHVATEIMRQVNFEEKNK